MVEVQTQTAQYSVYLLQAEADSDWVEERIASRLEQEAGLQPHFFRWVSIPGTARQQTMEEGFGNSGSCAVCYGTQGLGGMEKMMQEVATQRKGNDPQYALIPVLLPGSDPEALPKLLRDLEPVDFRDEKDFEWEFHRLVCGIKKVAPGPRPRANEPPPAAGASEQAYEKYLQGYVTTLKLIEAGERLGLHSKEEAGRLREQAFDKYMKLVTDDLVVPSIK